MTSRPLLLPVDLRGHQVAAGTHFPVQPGDRVAIRVDYLGLIRNEVTR